MFAAAERNMSATDGAHARGESHSGRVLKCAPPPSQQKTKIKLNHHPLLSALVYNRISLLNRSGTHPPDGRRGSHLIFHSLRRIANQ